MMQKQFISTGCRCMGHRGMIMKKRIFSIYICLLMVFSFSAFAFSGCEKKPLNTSDKKEVTLYDFEQWGPDFQLIRVLPGFGRVSVNTDIKYVKSGKQSARIDPISITGNMKSTMYFVTSSGVFDYDYSDFLYADFVRMEIYNAQSENQTVNAGLVGKISNIISFDKVSEEIFDLKPGWNTIYLPVDAFMVWLTSNDITNLQGIFLEFKTREATMVTDSTPRFYIDDVRIINRNTPAKTEFSPDDLILGQNEIADFENSWQGLLTTSSYVLEVVKASDYGITAPSGNNVLRLMIPGTNDGTWRTVLSLSETLIKLALDKLTDEQIEKAYFCYDVYNNFGGIVNMVTIYSGGLQTTCNTVFGRWYTYKYKLSDIGWSGAGSVYIDAVDTGYNREFFSDNFRIEIRD